MDFWSIILITGVFSGIMGWFFTIPLCTGILAYCDWRDGNEMDWAFLIGTTIATPFVWFFAIFEIIMLYSK